MHTKISSFNLPENSQSSEKQLAYLRFLSEINKDLNKRDIVNNNKMNFDQSEIHQYEDINNIISTKRNDETFLAQEEKEIESTQEKEGKIIENDYKEIINKVFQPSPNILSFIMIEEESKTISNDSTEYLCSIRSFETASEEFSKVKHSKSGNHYVKFLKNKRKRENDNLSSKELIKYYHQLQNQPQIFAITIPENNFNKPNKYSKRIRYPTLNHILGERIIYNYKKGKLIESYACISSNAVMNYNFMNVINENANSNKLKVKNKKKSEREITKISIKPLERKLLKPNKKFKPYIKVIKSDMNNYLKIDDKKF